MTAQISDTSIFKGKEHSLIGIKGGDGSLKEFFKSHLTPAERTRAQIEGWILGVW
jgi:hypothetical protein